MADAEEITGAEAIVKILEKEGVKYVFGLCGHANLSILDALHGSSIEFISVRNEATAVYMADAYYRASHQIAAVVTTVGPGIMNTVTAIADAMTDATPLLLIAGDVPNYLIGKGALQEISISTYGDQWEILRPVTKRAWRVPDVRDVPGSIQRALNIALSGSPGPVAVSIPMDFQAAVAKFDIDDPGQRRASRSRPRGDSDLIERAAEILSSAERPMIFAGNGVMLSKATPELVALAEHLSAPTATSLVGQGGFPKSHRLSVDCPSSVGNPAVSHAMKTADVVLGVGTRFSEIETNSWDPEVGFDPWNRQRLVQIDIDPEMIGKVYPVAVGIVGDAKAALADLDSAIRRRTGGRANSSADWVGEVLSLRDEWKATLAKEEDSDEVPIKTQRVLADLREVMPAGTIVHVDTGGFGYAVGQHIPVDEPQTYYYNLGTGSMGPCMATPLGSKLARPDKKVVSIVGDGGFTCQMSPIVTAVEYDIPVVWIVLNNYSFNSIEASQHKHFEGRLLGTRFTDREGQPYNPDFAALARACGALGYRVEQPGDLRSTLREALDSNRPCVIDVLSGQTRFAETYGWFEANRILAAEAEFKRNRASVGVAN